jgi:ELWxxDGT repeat protein
LEPLETRYLLSATLVTDINPFSVGSIPTNLTDVNGTLFFMATDGSGRELWKSDGTDAGTVLVRAFGSSAYVANFTNVNGDLYFTASDQGTGLELWKSDGTEGGTHIVTAIRPGRVGSDPSYLTNVNGELFFTADDGVHGRELWESDGTAAGTLMVKDIYTGSGSSGPTNLTNVNGELFFAAGDGVHGRQLWKSDGTADGTVLVKAIYPGFSYYYVGEDVQYYPNSSNPMELTNLNGELFFTAEDGVHGRKLWKSDGTEDGTVLVSAAATPGHLVVANSTLFFAASDPAHGAALWKSDGTEDGTVLVSAAAAPGFLTNVNGTLFFRTANGPGGPALWKSDGTADGTVFVKDIPPSGAPDNPLFTSVNGTLFFCAVNTTGAGFTLWKSDGTAAGTAVVSDVFLPGDLNGLTQSGGKLYFAARFHGTELWTSDGTTDGTAVVKLLNPRTMDSRPEQLTDVNGELFFTADDGIHGRELWKSDGTAAGTVLVKDINPGSTSSYPGLLTNVNGTLFFEANVSSTSFELWKSDGTEAGTVLVKAFTPGGINPQASSFTNTNGTLLFLVFAYPDEQLWKSDGTAAGTVLLKDLPPDQGGFYPGLTNVDGTVFFVAATATSKGLWKTDGTPAGTVLVREFFTGGTSLPPTNLTNVNGTLFFAANDGVHGHELWKSDGTEAGTVLVKDINPGPGAGITSYVASFTNVNGTLFFVADDGVHGRQVWKSDGTEAGTVLVKEIVPPNPYFYPLDLVNVNGTLFFMATDSAHGSTLWKSDGTEAGTVIVSDDAPAGNDPVNVNGTLFYSVLRPEQGQWLREVWQSDGTAAGTFAIFSAGPPAQLSPSYLTNVDGRLFFAADDGFHGDELWGMPVSVTAPTVESIVVNDGAVQRSEVTSLTVTFSTQVSLDPGALEVQRQDGSDVAISIATTVVAGKTVATITFTGPDIVNGSLTDGSYTLIVHRGLVHDGAGQTLAQDATLSFFRLLGDVDGDGVINDEDLAAAPTVTSVRLNESDAAGAQVHSITVHFSEGVALGDGAFSLVRQDGRSITLNVSTAEVDGNTVAVITFIANALIDGALPDGAYAFTIHGDQIHDGLGLALGHDFSGDRSVDFFGADGSGQPDLVGLFHPSGGGSGG